MTNNISNKYSCIILEDKQIYGLNKVHRNVLHAQQNISNVKSKIYPSNTDETDDMIIDRKLLNFVTDGIKFDQEVVKSKAAHSLPYSAKYVKEIFENKTDLGNDYIIKKRNHTKYGHISAEVRKSFNDLKINKGKLALIINERSDGEIEIVTDAIVKFKPKILFKKTRSETSLNEIDSTNVNKNISRSFYDLKEMDEDNNDRVLNVNEDEDEDQDQIEITPIFLTDLNDNQYKNKNNENKDEFKQITESLNIDTAKKRASTPNKLKALNDLKWDDHLINSLSENTARWIVMKNTFEPKQKKKLNEMIEKKYGKYTRDIQDLELLEYDLSEYEIKKISEEKARIEELENEKLTERTKEDIQNENSKRATPLYRLPVGLKREALAKLKLPDTGFNKTAHNIIVEPSCIEQIKTYDQKMLELKSVTNKTLFKTDNLYQIEMLEGNVKHKFKRDEKKIELENGKKFEKSLQSVFPIEFTEWISGVEIYDKPQMKKPVKGKKRWTKLPEFIDFNEIKNPTERGSQLDNYWNLMPTTTDNQLRKIAKSNLTVARIVDEWRKKWQTSNRWTMAEVDELIKDMKDPQANIRFQAVVVCSRAVEQIHIFINKMKKYHEKYPPKLEESDDDDNNEDMNDKSNATFSTEKSSKKSSSMATISNKTKIKRFISINYNDTDNLIYSANLFETIESLLSDINQKVKLAAAIAIFILVRNFKRPMLEKIQISKDNAENILRNILNGHNNADKYTAAQCLSIDGICEEMILRILLKNYFDSTEQYTKEQVTKTLSDLSTDNEIVSKLIEEYLNSDHSRERILAAKLIPCMRRSISREATKKLIHLMWYDINANVKKVAAQTLGRTGRGREVHNEINNRLESKSVFDRIEALKIINFIGIMTNKMINNYLKCFRDDHISVRELACRSAQCLWEKDQKLIDTIVFMAKYDQVNKLKALAIQTLGLIGDYNSEIRKCLLWALQFEIDPLVRTQACHTLILLTKNPNDEELIDILQERHLIEEQSIVKNEIMTTLLHLGFNPNRELPIVTKIKSDVAKFNDKNEILAKIKEIEKHLMFEMDKKRFIWSTSPLKSPKKNIEIIEEEQENETEKNDIIFKQNKISTTKQMKKFQEKLDKLKKDVSVNENSSNSSFLAKLVD